MPKNTEYGLLVNYEYCTGCHACTIACAQEYQWPAGMAGIKVMEVVESLPEDKSYLVFLPFLTELCILCKPRTKKGQKPACVQHCMASCLSYGTIKDLVKEMAGKPRMALWKPR